MDTILYKNIYDSAICVHGIVNIIYDYADIENITHNKSRIKTLNEIKDIKSVSFINDDFISVGTDNCHDIYKIDYINDSINFKLIHENINSNAIYVDLDSVICIVYNNDGFKYPNIIKYRKNKSYLRFNSHYKSLSNIVMFGISFISTDISTQPYEIMYEFSINCFSPSINKMKNYLVINSFNNIGIYDYQNGSHIKTMDRHTIVSLAYDSIEDVIYYYSDNYVFMLNNSLKETKFNNKIIMKDPINKLEYSYPYIIITNTLDEYTLIDIENSSKVFNVCSMPKLLNNVYDNGRIHFSGKHAFVIDKNLIVYDLITKKNVHEIIINCNNNEHSTFIKCNDGYVTIINYENNSFKLSGSILY